MENSLKFVFIGNFNGYFRVRIELPDRYPLPVFFRTNIAPKLCVN